jgi:hypothetical protein
MEVEKVIIAFFIVIFILVLPFAVVQAARDTSKAIPHNEVCLKIRHPQLIK